MQLNGDETGVMVDAPENGPFVNASFQLETPQNYYGIGKTEKALSLSFSVKNVSSIDKKRLKASKRL